MNNRRKIIVISAFLVFVLILILYINFRLSHYQPLANIDKELNQTANRNFVRLSLFNTMTNKISMEIPEDWEGSYRVKDNGNIVTIYYINGIDGWDLLSFKQFSLVEWKSNQDEDWQKVVENKKIIIAYKLSTGEDIGPDQKLKFNNMRVDIPGLLKTIKLR